MSDLTLAEIMKDPEAAADDFVDFYETWRKRYFLMTCWKCGNTLVVNLGAVSVICGGCGEVYHLSSVGESDANCGA